MLTVHEEAAASKEKKREIAQRPTQEGEREEEPITPGEEGRGAKRQANDYKLTATILVILTLFEIRFAHHSCC